MPALSVAAVAQKQGSEVSIEGTGFFTKDSVGNGTVDCATDIGGLLVAYRYHVLEANYGYDRSTQM